MKQVQILLFLFPIRKHKVNEQEKKLSSVEVQFKRLFLLHFPSFLLSSELIFAIAFVASLFILSSWFYFAPLLKKRKKKKKSLILSTLRHQFSLQSSSSSQFGFALLQFFKKKKKKIIVKSDIFQQFYFFVLVSYHFSFPLLHFSKKYKKRVVFSASHCLLSFIIATILDLLSQRSRRETSSNCSVKERGTSFYFLTFILSLLLFLRLC